MLEARDDLLLLSRGVPILGHLLGLVLQPEHLSRLLLVRLLECGVGGLELLLRGERGGVLLVERLLRVRVRVRLRVRVRVRLRVRKGEGLG